LGFLQPIVGHFHGLNTKEYQPEKIAAIEGLWETQSGAPLILFALPDQQYETNRWSIELPKLSSLVLTHDLNGQLKGIKETDKRDRPNVPIVFFSFRIMVGLGLVMILVGSLGCLLLRNGRLYRSRFFLVGCVLMMPIGFVATIAGWIVSEAGRQPWVIYGIVRTSEMVKPLSAAAVEHSLLMIGCVYASTLVGFIYLIGRFIKRGPSSGYAPGYEGSRFASSSARESPGLLRPAPSNEGLIHDEST
jgi:cytochrome d ubiquinol oxidase subunit I